VFNGVGRIVEIPSLPTDPANSSRDDLVFPEGTLHLLSTGGDITSLSLNPANCRFRLTLQGQTGQITGDGAPPGARCNDDRVYPKRRAMWS
jgi:hypothetical protein